MKVSVCRIPEIEDGSFLQRERLQYELQWCFNSLMSKEPLWKFASLS